MQRLKDAATGGKGCRYSDLELFRFAGRVIGEWCVVYTERQPVLDAYPRLTRISRRRPDLGVVCNTELLGDAQDASRLVYARHTFPACQRKQTNRLLVSFGRGRVLGATKLERLLDLDKDVVDTDERGDGWEDEGQAEIAGDKEIFAVQIDTNGAEGILMDLSLHVKARWNSPCI